MRRVPTKTDTTAVSPRRASFHRIRGARFAPSSSPTRLFVRHGFAVAMRRDPRRFGQAQPRFDAMPVAQAPLVSDNLRLFAHSFGAAFLFVSVLIA